MPSVSRAVTLAMCILLLTQPTARAGVTAAVAGTTTISSTGNTLTELKIKPGTRLDPSAVKVDLIGGTYAFARIVTDRPDARCPAHTGRYCEAWHFDWIRGISDRVYGNEPFVAVSDPPLWTEDHLRLWILTDGKARLTLRFPGLKGTAQFTPQHRAQGGVVTLQACRICLPSAAGGYSAEGARVRLPKDSTVWAEAYAVATDASGRSSSNALRSSEICIYPRGGADASASSDPAAHPEGCDDSSSGASAAERTARSTQTIAASAQFTSSATEWSFWSEARDSVYFGRRALDIASSVTDGASSRAYGIWFVHHQ